MNKLTIAVEALRARAELGLNVSDDIAVVGCDDKMFVGLLSPALTTLRVPKYDISARSARIAPLSHPRPGERGLAQARAYRPRERAAYT